MITAGQIATERYVGVLQGDATRLPFADGVFDRVITSEMLEHIQADVDALGELVRVLKAGGTFAATVPAWLPEKISWMLSDDYHAPQAAGGHVRIYSATELKAKLRSAGLELAGSHHAHALHSPYWWLKCAVGVRNEDHPLVSRYRRLLEWEIVERPRSLRYAERVLSPLLGKSYVIYGRKPGTAPAPASARRKLAVHAPA
jgi:SAM-dependent methyltransferase